jgi:hypothetical protein
VAFNIWLIDAVGPSAAFAPAITASATVQAQCQRRHDPAFLARDQ